MEVNLPVYNLSEINQWIDLNHRNYIKIEQSEFPPHANDFYFRYRILMQLLNYHKYEEVCKAALIQLMPIVECEFHKVKFWLKKFDKLGAVDLLMFEVDYFDWEEDIPYGLLKVSNEIYTYKARFKNIHRFCRVFAILHWKFELHKVSDDRLFTDARNELLHIIGPFHQ